MPREFITLANAGKRLALSELTVRRYVAQGLLTGYRVGPRQLRVDAAEVEALARPIPTVATIAPRVQ